MTDRPPSCHARHWFTVHGMVGLRRPTCERCGAPNPRPLTAEQQANFDYAVGTGHTTP